MLGPIELMVVFAAVAILAAVGVVLLRREHRSRPSAEVMWARSRGLEPTEEVLTIVGPELARVRRYRRVGAVLGFVGIPVAATLPGLDDPLVGLIVGWAIAVVIAEAVLRRRPSGAVGAVPLPRRVEQYAPRRLFVVQGAVVAGLLVAGAWALTVEPVVVGGHMGAAISNAVVVGCVGLGTAIGLVAHLLQRWIVARPQPVTDEIATAVDDAFRSDSVHALGAAGIALGGVLLMTVLRRPAEANVLNPWIDLLAFSVFVGSMLSCLWWANRAWTVRRPRASASLASPAV